jgi:Sec-independent protein translocase protein TatA
MYTSQQQQQATIVLVGYFVLGPSELYKLTKEIGKFFQNIRTLSSEASKSFETSMEDQLDLQELRKAQVELNQAFNFRRSINVDDSAEAFSEVPKMVEDTAAVASTATTAAAATVASSNKPKKRKRVKKKKVVDETSTTTTSVDNVNQNIPDLDMSAEFGDEFKNQMGIMDDNISSSIQKQQEEEELARVRAERIQRLQAAGQGGNDSDTNLAAQALKQSSTMDSEQASAVESARFASQLSVDEWNKRIMENEDKLSPLSQIMQRLAILEEERLAANQRLDEEFQRRADIEDMYYKEKRQVLEDAAAEISAGVYNDVNSSTTATSSSSSSSSNNKSTAMNGENKA